MNIRYNFVGFNVKWEIPTEPSPALFSMEAMQESDFDNQTYEKLITDTVNETRVGPLGLSYELYSVSNK